MWSRAGVAMRAACAPLAERSGAHGSALTPLLRNVRIPGAHVRPLRTSASVRASEDNRSDMMSSALPPGFEKLGESPEALAAINQLMEVLQRQGIDVSGGQQPSMSQLYKLATNSEVRDCASRGTSTC